MRPTCMNHEPMVSRLWRVVITQNQWQTLVEWANHLQSTTISQFRLAANVWSPSLPLSNTRSIPLGCKTIAMFIITCKNCHWIQNIRRGQTRLPSLIFHIQEDFKSKRLILPLQKETEMPWLLIYTPRKRSCEPSIQFVCQEQVQEAISSEIKKKGILKIEQKASILNTNFLQTNL